MEEEERRKRRKCLGRCMMKSPDRSSSNFAKKERKTGARWDIGRREEATVRGDKSGGKIRDRPTAPETQAIKREGAEPEGKSHSANRGREFRTKFRRTKKAVQNDQKLCPLSPSFMSSRSIVRNEVLNFPNQGLFSFHFSFSAQYLDSGCAVAVPTLAVPCSCIIPPNKEKREGFPSTVPPERSGCQKR